MWHERFPRAPVLAGAALAALAAAATACASAAKPGGPDPEYVRRYAAEGAPELAPVAEYADTLVFPPRVRGTPSAERPAVRPSPLDVSDARIAAARTAALRNEGVRRALGDRFVDITGGIDVPEKAPGGAQPAYPVILEFFSYSNRRAFRAGVARDSVVFLRAMPTGYRPPETREEVARAARLLAGDPRYARLVAGTEPEGLLTPCRESIRCLYIHFIRRDRRVVLSATVDLMTGRVLEAAPSSDEPN